MGARSFAYDQAGRLVSVTDDGIVTAQYVYNGLGQRVIKEAGGQVTHFHYELDGKLIAETPAGGSTVEGTEHIYRGKGLLARVDASSGAVYHYHTNYLGAVHQITDAAGMIVWEAVYMPFGRATVNAGSTVESSWRMPGQYHDAETGLHYNYFRYYDPETGRYLTPDPIGLAGGINPYAYVSNNPVGAIDPMGLSLARVDARVFADALGSDECNGDSKAREIYQLFYVLALFQDPEFQKQIRDQQFEMAANVTLMFLPMAMGMPPMIKITPKDSTKLLPQFDKSLIDDVLSSAAKARKQTTEGARAVAKKLGHAQSGGYESAFKGIKPTQASADKLIRDILSNPSSSTYGYKTVDVYNSMGQGVRFDRTTNKFIGFIEQSLSTR